MLTKLQVALNLLRLLRAIGAAAVILLTIARAQADGLTITPAAPLGDGYMVRHVYGHKLGDQCSVEVQLKDKTKRYFTGAWQGWALCHGTRQPSKTGVVTHIPKGETLLVHSSTKAYLAFKGAHSTLLFMSETDWFTVEGAIK